ncbi:putative exported domain protein [Burkholderia mallei]|nr:putative exported domain protein [Burkholderia mallei]KOT11593.1 putative exported domain protein [Burkholderia mallei]KOT22795.1 putative exported domain protein [Burkholderia mallei]
MCQFDASIPPYENAGVADLATLPASVYLPQLRRTPSSDRRASLRQHFRDPQTGKQKADAFRASLRTSSGTDHRIRPFRLHAGSCARAPEPLSRSPF